MLPILELSTLPQETGMNRIAAHDASWGRTVPVGGARPCISHIGSECRLHGTFGLLSCLYILSSVHAVTWEG